MTTTNELRAIYQAEGLAAAAARVGLAKWQTYELIHVDGHVKSRAEIRFERVRAALLRGHMQRDVAASVGISRRQVQRIAARLRESGELTKSPLWRPGKRVAA